MARSTIPFVNLNPGPRLFEQSLDMQSLDHHGVLFDNLFAIELRLRRRSQRRNPLRIYKNKLYHFSGLFRRDRNIWNYNLLAIP